MRQHYCRHSLPPTSCAVTFLPVVLWFAHTHSCHKNAGGFYHVYEIRYFTFFDYSTDESASENVLKAIQTFASLCGCLDLQIPRDAFITAICKASLPPHYALTVLNTVPQGAGLGRSKFWLLLSALKVLLIGLSSYV